MASGTHIEAWAALASPVVGGYGMVERGVSLGDSRLKSIAAKYSVSTAQVALQWMVKTGVTPVTGTCNRRHASADLGSFSGFDLSSSDIARLNDLSVDQAVSLADNPSNITLVTFVWCATVLLSVSLLSFL